MNECVSSITVTFPVSLLPVDKSLLITPFKLLVNRCLTESAPALVLCIYGQYHLFYLLYLAIQLLALG